MYLMVGCLCFGVLLIFVNIYQLRSLNAGMTVGDPDFGSSRRPIVWINGKNVSIYWILYMYLVILINMWLVLMHTTCTFGTTPCLMRCESWDVIQCTSKQSCEELIYFLWGGLSQTSDNCTLMWPMKGFSVYDTACNALIVLNRYLFNMQTFTLLLWLLFTDLYCSWEQDTWIMWWQFSVALVTQGQKHAVGRLMWCGLMIILLVNWKKCCNL